MMSNTMLITKRQDAISSSSPLKLTLPETRFGSGSSMGQRMPGRSLTQIMMQTIQNLRVEIQGGFQTVEELFDSLYGEETRG